MNPENQDQKDIAFGRAVRAYIEEKRIPLDHFIEVIDDSKVIPMLRGKGVEYSAKDAIQMALEQYAPGTWLVEKKNLNAQPGMPDEDITITNITYPKYPIIVEAKSASLGTLTRGVKTKKAGYKKVVHYQVKCHRSRVNHTLALELAEEELAAEKLKNSMEESIPEITPSKKGKKKKTGHGDRYKIGDFDLVIANPLNGFYTNVKYTSSTNDEYLLETLRKFYGITKTDSLPKALEQDWRFVEPQYILDEKNYVEPMPRVMLENDTNWKTLKQLPETLNQILENKISKGQVTVQVKPQPKQIEFEQQNFLDEFLDNS